MSSNGFVPGRITGIVLVGLSAAYDKPTDTAQAG